MKRVSSTRAFTPVCARYAARAILPTGVRLSRPRSPYGALRAFTRGKVGLLFTKGFRAVQEVQTQARDGNLFDYFYAKPQPIAPQSLTREIPERSDHAGHVLVRLDREAVRVAARELKAAGVQSIAV